jgi:hypothetical protein
MYKGKPLIAGKAPWYRHHSLPWGWYSLSKIGAGDGAEIVTEGYLHPEDGGGNTYRIDIDSYFKGDGGTIIDLGDKAAKSFFTENTFSNQFGAPEDE